VSPVIYKGITLRSILYYVGIFAVSCLFVGYAIFQARFLLTGPVLTFEDNPDSIQSQRVITLQGKAENIVYISLNGRQIYTDKDGYFQELIVLENGYTMATLQAHDRYGRSRSYTQRFVYTPPKDPLVLSTD
jgi:hypothetical protein